MIYLFKTTTTMKHYNCRKWWISRDCVSDKHIEADNVTEALEKYREAVEDNDFVTISKSALKNRQAQYKDYPDGRMEQTGYVITGSMEFYDSDTGNESRQFIELWITVYQAVEFPAPGFIRKTA